MRKNKGKVFLQRFFGFMAVLAVLLISVQSISHAQEDSPKAERNKAAAMGDCEACHGEKMVPDGHVSTKGLTLKDCGTCHSGQITELKHSMPSDHVHQLSKVSCADCHGDADPPEWVGTDACLKCHDIEEVAKRSDKGEDEENPHNSPHYGTDLDCDLCHHQHEKSESYCAQCHDFDFVVPSPITPFEYKAPAGAGGEAPGAGAMDCNTCHGDAQYTENFNKTPHGTLGCVACHQGITDFTAHMSGEQKPEKVSCAKCHKDVAKEYAGSYHDAKLNMSCESCHTDIHPTETAKDEGKVAVINKCTTCHGKDPDFISKGHAASVMKGNQDAATCADCHGVHNTPVFGDTPVCVARCREFYTQKCISCHSDPGVAERNNLSVATVEEFKDTYHGKVLFMGYSERVAGCSDCHTAHNILPSDNPESPVNQANLIETCGKCHEGFHPRFVSFISHPDENNPEHYLALYLVRIFMLWLLAGVFLFFWLHVILWWRKSYWEKSRLKKLGIKEPKVLPEEEGSRYVKRFGLRDRILHVTLILSFFGVVISGFPLKYYETAWSKVIMNILGGAEYAGLIHRISATVMWILFLYVTWLSFRFLFPKKVGVKGWLGRLFGPDSLFPNLKDFADIWGMFKWFFGKGEMPRFERWTYWEKFDFMAVFWGMFVIGLSGLILWFPEGSSYILPGWIINVATIAHSEEAFLAAIFIFTVHFFNNSFLPTKFPMETYVFTGCYTLEDLKRERPLEYERIKAEGRIDEMWCDGPGVFTQLFAGFFGLFSIVLGLVLTVLIFWAIFMY